MIVINCALKQEEIKTFITTLDPTIEFIQKQGISLQFHSSDDTAFAPIIKQALKTEPQFKALFFNVEVK